MNNIPEGFAGLRTIYLYRFNITAELRVQNTLKTQQAFCLALSHMDRMCGYTNFLLIEYLIITN